jgi:hypothetical protein
MEIPRIDTERIALCQQMTNEIKKDYPYVRGVNIFVNIEDKVVVFGDWSINTKEFIQYIENKYNLKYGFYESYPITNEDALIFYPNKIK